MKFLYPVNLAADEDEGGFVVTFPDFGWGVTQGETEDEALANAADCLETMVASCIEDKEDVPAPSALKGRPGVALSGRMAAKAALHTALRESGLRPADLARRLGHGEHIQVRRLLDPRHRSAPEALERALRALGKYLVVEVKDAA